MFRTGKAILLCRLGRHGEALETCNTAIAIDPGDAKAHLVGAVCLDRLGRSHESCASLNRAVRCMAGGEEPARAGHARDVMSGPYASDRTGGRPVPRCNDRLGDAADIEALLRAGESVSLAFLDTRLGGGDPDLGDEQACGAARAVSGLLNAEGGNLLIGVAGDGSPHGLARGGGSLGSEERAEFMRRLADALAKLLPNGHARHVTITMALARGRDICRCAVERPSWPALASDGGSSCALYVRRHSSTERLDGGDAVRYVFDHWVASRAGRAPRHVPATPTATEDASFVYPFAPNSMCSR